MCGRRQLLMSEPQCLTTPNISWTLLFIILSGQCLHIRTALMSSKLVHLEVILQPALEDYHDLRLWTSLWETPSHCANLLHFEDYNTDCSMQQCDSRGNSLAHVCSLLLKQRILCWSPDTFVINNTCSELLQTCWIWIGFWALHLSECVLTSDPHKAFLDIFKFSWSLTWVAYDIGIQYNVQVTLDHVCKAAVLLGYRKDMHWQICF